MYRTVPTKAMIFKYLFSVQNYFSFIDKTYAFKYFVLKCIQDTHFFYS